MKMGPPIPILRVFNHALAKNFYVDWLGFKVDWEHEFEPNSPKYIQVTRDGVTLHLSEHYGDCTPGARVFIEAEDVGALHSELHSRPNPNMNPGIEITPWNSKCLEVIDPFGNRLTFNQSLDKK
jgi:catechol 2,3-dioxygenase-like lactoylglutathione lyase family enzyme